MKKISYFVLLGALSSTLTLSAFGVTEGSTSSDTPIGVTDGMSAASAPALPAPAPAWKATAATYFYNFEGTKQANENLYSFKDSTLWMQAMTLSYQINSDWSLMVLGTYLDNYVETEMAGKLYKDRTKGIGDTWVTAMRPIALSQSLLTIYDIGVNLPTGTINQANKDAPERHYAYNMQGGSGTIDTVLGATIMYFQPQFETGSRLSGTFRNGGNANGYRLGNLYRTDAWFDVPTGTGLTPRIVGYYKWKDAIQGEDKTLGRNPYTEFYYHAQVNWDVSAAVKYTQKLQGTAVSLNAEIGTPLLQDSRNVDNVVVSTQYYANLGLTGNF